MGRRERSFTLRIFVMVIVLIFTVECFCVFVFTVGLFCLCVLVYLCLQLSWYFSLCIGVFVFTEELVFVFGYLSLHLSWYCHCFFLCIWKIHQSTHFHTGGGEREALWRSCLSFRFCILLIVQVSDWNTIHPPNWRGSSRIFAGRVKLFLVCRICLQALLSWRLSWLELMWVFVSSADFVSKTRKEKESRNHILRSFSLISYHIRTGLALTALCKSYSQTRASSQRFILSLSSLHCYFLQTQSAPVFQDAEQNPRAELFILPIS